MFGGFRVKIEVPLNAVIDEIVSLAVSELFRVLETYNFRELLVVARNKIFHVHNSPIDEIFRRRIVWICDHV